MVKDQSELSILMFESFGVKKMKMNTRTKRKNSQNAAIIPVWGRLQATVHRPKFFNRRVSEKIRKYFQ